MLTPLHNNLDCLYIYRAFSLPSGVKHIDIREMVENQLREKVLPGFPVQTVLGQSASDLKATFRDFDLHLEWLPSNMARFQVYFQPRALHEGPKAAWTQAMDVVDGLAVGIGDEVDSFLRPEDWRIRELHLHADLQGWKVGLSTADRLVSNGTDVRTVVTRGGEVETIYASMLAVYNKTREVARKPKKGYISSLWSKYDPNAGDVWRVEYRLRRGKPGEDLLEAPIDLDAIWHACLKRVRLPRGKGRDAPADPAWRALDGLHFDPPWPDGFWGARAAQAAQEPSPSQTRVLTSVSADSDVPF